MNEEMDYTTEVYEMYRSFDTGESCLSFAFLDSQMNQPMTYPLTCMIACGTQAPPQYPNYVHIMKMTNLTKIIHDSEEESDEDEPIPELFSVSIPHEDVVNRLKTHSFYNSQFVSTFSSNTCVYLYDISQSMKNLENPQKAQKRVLTEQIKPCFTFHGHSREGYALDWSKISPVRMLSGDCGGQIFMWELTSNGQFSTVPLHWCCHADSVEDLQWSNQNPSVFASCSVDRSIRMWDIRSKDLFLGIEEAHPSDVNVISLHPTEPFIVSGGDEGGLRVWDTRNWSLPVWKSTFYNQAVTSVEWSHVDPSVFVASSEENSISIWDYEAQLIEEEDEDPNLLFDHKGIRDVREVHWWKGLSGVIGGISIDGFDIFKTISA